MTKEIALKDLLLEEIKSEEYNKNFVSDFLMEKRIPQDLKNYILKLVDVTDNIEGKIYNIGKIIVAKIIEFVKANPNMAIGMAIGAAAGALVSLFTNWIPFVGQLLSAIAMAAGVFIGAIAGVRVDKIENREQLDNSLVGVFGDAISVAKKFFNLISDIIETLKKS